MTDSVYLRKANNGSGLSQESLSNQMYNAAHYTNIMVEYENGNREMAVDVPASFVGKGSLVFTPFRSFEQEGRPAGLATCGYFRFL